MKKGLITAACISSLFLGGCNGTIDAEDIMLAPKLSIPQKNIQNIIKKNLGEDIELVKPRNLNSAIKYIDIDNDNQEEIFVFYRLRDEGDNTNRFRTAMFDFKEKEVKVYNIIKGNGYKVFFSDLDGDKRLEIVLGMVDRIGVRATLLPKSFSIYEYDGENLDEVFNGTYDGISTGDIDNDGKEEILLTSFDIRTGAAIGLYNYRDGELIEIDEQEIGIVDFRASTIKVGFASKDTMGIFIQGISGANTDMTYMFIYKDGKLMNPFKTNKNIEGNIRSYWETREPRDINGDGIMEIALNRPLKGYENLTRKVDVRVKTNWYKWDERDSIKYVMSSIVRGYKNYEILFPQGLDDNITYTSKLRENKLLDVFEYINGDERKKIFEILTVEGKKNTEGLEEEYKYLNSHRGKVYFVRVLNEELYRELNFHTILKTNFKIGW